MFVFQSFIIDEVGQEQSELSAKDFEIVTGFDSKKSQKVFYQYRSWCRTKKTAEIDKFLLTAMTLDKPKTRSSELYCKPKCTLKGKYGLLRYTWQV